MPDARVYLIVDTPEHSRVIQAGQEQAPTTIAAYLIDVPHKAKRDDVIGEFIARNQFPPTTRFAVVGAARVDALVLKPTLEPGELLPGHREQSDGMGVA